MTEDTYRASILFLAAVACNAEGVPIDPYNLRRWVARALDFARTHPGSDKLP